MAGSKLVAPARVMPERSRESLRLQLQAATRNVKWTYSAFWQLSRGKEKVLVWGDGYYNGSIKTRKTVHARELTPEEFGLQRSEQLRDLYDTLSNAKSGQQQARKPSALNPEDLAETEWFFLVCMSCSFADGVGLPGRAIASGRFVWQCGTNEATTKVFTRSLLAKTACIQTVVCIPLWDGVLEFGTTDHVQEDPKLVQHVLSFFSEQSNHDRTENPISTLKVQSPPENSRQQLGNKACHSQNEISSLQSASPCQESSLGFPKYQCTQDSSPSSFIGDANAEVGARNSKRAKLSSSLRAEAADSDPLYNGRISTVPCIQGPRASTRITYQQLQGADLSNRSHKVQYSGDMLLLGLGQSNEQVLHVQAETAERYEEDKSDEDPEDATSASAFVVWENGPTPSQKCQHPENQQWMLKEALFRIPHHYGKEKEDSKEAESSFATIDTASEDKRGPGAGSHNPGGGTEETNGSHVLAERRRREKLNDRFMTLRALVPFVTKMDKASILGDAIEYVKDLQRRVKELETQNQRLQQAPVKQAGSTNGTVAQTGIHPDIQEATVGHPESAILEQVRSGDSKAAETDAAENGENAAHGHVDVHVSLENDVALLKLHCPWRPTLLLDILQTLNDFQLEICIVQASTLSGSFTSSLEAKVRMGPSGTRLPMTEVTEALQRAAKGFRSDPASVSSPV